LRDALRVASEAHGELRFGEGRISGAIAVFLGACSLLAVLCFHFPEYLTTPERRAAYDVVLLRNLLRGGMLAAVVAGSIAVLRGRSKLGFLGLALALAAQWLGGANVEVGAFDQPVMSFGLDWLVLALLVGQGGAHLARGAQAAECLPQPSRPSSANSHFRYERASLSGPSSPRTRCRATAAQAPSGASCR